MIDEPLEKRRLGRTGFMVTPLGLGGAHLGRIGPGREDFDDDVAVRTVHRALKLGINVIDTAPLYGESQRRIGLALENWFDSTRARDDLIISTKTGSEPDGTKDYSADWTMRSVEKSLDLLKTDYIDIVLVHDPPDLEPVFEVHGALEALLRLKSQGVIRAIGLGARPHEFHQQCINSGDFDVSLTFCDYNLLDQSAARGVLKPAAAEDVGVYNGAAVMLGLLGGDDPAHVAKKLGGFATEERVNRAVEMYRWCQRRDQDILALNLQFCLRERRIGSTLVGAANPAQIEADVSAISEPIPEELWREFCEEFDVKTGDAGT